MNIQSPEVKRGRKFDQVLDGARRVFLNDGFEGASVDEIAATSGVSKATLYSYFPDKRLLFTEVLRAECRLQSERAMATIDQTAPAEVVLRAAARHMVGFFLSDFGQRMFRICVAESARFPELGREFYASGPAVANAKLVEYFTQANAGGDLKIDNLELAACQFMELCKAGLFVRSIFGVQTDFSDAEVERVIDGAVGLFLSRYRAPERG